MLYFAKQQFAVQDMKVSVAFLMCTVVITIVIELSYYFLQELFCFSKMLDSQCTGIIVLYKDESPCSETFVSIFHLSVNFFFLLNRMVSGGKIGHFLV